MAPIGLALLWAGYTVTYFGFCSLRGPGVGLFDLIIPGRTVIIPGGGAGGGSTIFQRPDGSRSKLTPAEPGVKAPCGPGFHLAPVAGRPAGTVECVPDLPSGVA